MVIFAVNSPISVLQVLKVVHHPVLKVFKVIQAICRTSITSHTGFDRSPRGKTNLSKTARPTTWARAAQGTPIPCLTVLCFMTAMEWGRTWNTDRCDKAGDGFRQLLEDYQLRPNHNKVGSPLGPVLPGWVFGLGHPGLFGHEDENPTPAKEAGMGHPPRDSSGMRGGPPAL